MLNEKLDLYLKENYYPFHMPGAKRSDILRKDLPYSRDLTEIEGFDNLNDPKEIFVEMQEKLAEIYGVNKVLLTTNGSTSGILSVIRSLTYKNKKILIQRSSHKAVYNSCELNKLDVSYLNVITNDVASIVGIDYKDLEKKLSENNFSCLVVTSPSYEGYILELDRIYEICQRYSTKLIVDLAHGSHLPLTKFYSKSFDLAITSFHKNLSALTPAAAVLINDLDLYDEVKRNMAIFQSSSPSYIILQSIDEMIVNYPSFNKMYDKLDKNLDKIYNEDLNHLEIIDSNSKDRSKILISTKNTNISGEDLAKLLRNYKIEIEMAYPNYALLIATIFDRDDGFKKLKNALIKIDKKISTAKNSYEFSLNIPKKELEIYECINKSKRHFSLDEAGGKVSADFVYAYPPGIPLLAPGEVIDDEVISNIRFLLENDINVNLKGDGLSCLIDKN